MKNIFNFLLCFLPVVTLHAQINEIGVFLGGSNFVGDVGNTTYIAPEKLAFGVLYKWNASPRHAYRFSYTQSNVYANDFDSKETGRNKRGQRFENTIREFSAGLEYNFFDFNLHKGIPKITPYLFSGISYFNYHEFSRKQTINPITGAPTPTTPLTKGVYDSSLAIPIILGIKSNISSRFVLAAEVGARYTFADNIDGSFPDDKELYHFGNFNNNDWYVFSGITLTYTFGQKPCYCAQ